MSAINSGKMQLKGNAHDSTFLSGFFLASLTGKMTLVLLQTIKNYTLSYDQPYWLNFASYGPEIPIVICIGVFCVHKPGFLMLGHIFCLLMCCFYCYYV